MGFPITGQDDNLVALAFYVGFFFWEFPKRLLLLILSTVYELVQLPIVWIFKSVCTFSVSDLLYADSRFCSVFRQSS